MNLIVYSLNLLNVTRIWQKSRCFDILPPVASRPKNEDGQVPVLSIRVLYSTTMNVKGLGNLHLFETVIWLLVQKRQSVTKIAKALYIRRAVLACHFKKSAVSVWITCFNIAVQDWVLAVGTWRWWW